MFNSRKRGKASKSGVSAIKFAKNGHPSTVVSLFDSVPVAEREGELGEATGEGRPRSKSDSDGAVVLDEEDSVRLADWFVCVSDSSSGSVITEGNAMLTVWHARTN